MPWPCSRPLPLFSEWSASQAPPGAVGQVARPDGGPQVAVSQERGRRRSSRDMWSLQSHCALQGARAAPGAPGPSPRELVTQGVLEITF